MSRDIETEQLLFVGKLFVIAPRRDRSSSCQCYRRGDFIEQRDLACGPIAMRGRGRDERFIDAGKKFRALAIKKIERAGFNQTLEHFSICDPGAKSPANFSSKSKIAFAFFSGILFVRAQPSMKFFRSFDIFSLSFLPMARRRRSAWPNE